MGADFLSNQNHFLDISYSYYWQHVVWSSMNSGWNCVCVCDCNPWELPFGLQKRFLWHVALKEWGWKACLLSRDKVSCHGSIWSRLRRTDFLRSILIKAVENGLDSKSGQSIACRKLGKKIFWHLQRWPLLDVLPSSLSIVLISHVLCLRLGIPNLCHGLDFQTLELCFFTS